MTPPKNLRRPECERMTRLVQEIKSCRTAIAGKDNISAYDRPELHPAYAELQTHLDHALRWAEEIDWIIAAELTPVLRSSLAG